MKFCEALKERLSIMQPTSTDVSGLISFVANIENGEELFVRVCFSFFCFPSKNSYHQ